MPEQLRKSLVTESAGTYDRDHSTGWDAAGVRELRNHIGVTQAELAALLSTRQQTVSEWERGSSSPRRMSRRLLQLVAEEHGYYRTTPDDPTAASNAPSGTGRRNTDSAEASQPTGETTNAIDEDPGS